MEVMSAVRIHGYGGPEVLTYEEAPRPSVGDGDVLVRVQATSVNPFDAAMRAGYMSDYFETHFPLILGTDVAGVVEEVGSAVAAFTPGDKVFGRGGVFRDGSYAQFAAVAESDVALLPENLDSLKAAAIPHVLLTAWQALFELADLAEGQTVLIHGAAGGVGHMAVQLAKWRGAHVIGTASGNIDFLREIGVDQAVDYSASRFEDVVQDVDVVLDTVGGDTQERSWSILKPGGVLVSTIQAPSPETAAEHGVQQHMVTSAPPIGQTLKEVAGMVDAGIITPEVSATLPITDVRLGHEMIEQHHTRGKIVLEVT